MVERNFFANQSFTLKSVVLEARPCGQRLSIDLTQQLAAKADENGSRVSAHVPVCSCTAGTPLRP